MPRYGVRNQDPRWITLKRPATCAHQGCNAALAKGTRAFWYPTSSSAFGEACGHGEDRAREFASAVSDEEAYSR